MKFERFEDIIAWQKSEELAIDVYKMFQFSKDFGFKDQIQRASVSVMNNIAEACLPARQGFERRTNNEFIYFLFIAKGSCGEVRSMLHLANKLNKINSMEYNRLKNKAEEISKIFSGLIKSLKE